MFKLVGVAAALIVVLAVDSTNAVAATCKQPKGSTVVKESSAAVVWLENPYSGPEEVDEEFDYAASIYGCSKLVGKTFLLIESRFGDADHRYVESAKEITLGRRTVTLRINFKRASGCDSRGGYRYSLVTGDWVRLWAHRLADGSCG